MGPKGARELTQEEAERIMTLVLEGKLTEAQLGAFFIAMRVKGETAQELSAFARTTRQFCHLISPDVKPLVDSSGPYDGKTDTVNFSLVSALIAAGAGLSILLHGEKDMPVKYGVGPGDVLYALGVNPDLPPARVERLIEEAGVGYLKESRYCPALFRLRKVRTEIGLRPFLSVIEKILNPAGAQVQMVGITHGPYLDKMVEVVQGVGTKRGMIVQGIEGTQELHISKRTKVKELGQMGIRAYDVNPAELGLVSARPEELAGASAQNSARAAIKILKGEKGALRDAALLSAAVLIYLGGAAPSIKEGLDLAIESLDSGAALKRLSLLQKLTPI